MTELKEAQIAEEHRRILVNEYCRNCGKQKSLKAATLAVAGALCGELTIAGVPEY